MEPVHSYRYGRELDSRIPPYVTCCICEGTVHAYWVTTNQKIDRNTWKGGAGSVDVRRPLADSPCGIPYRQ